MMRVMLVSNLRVESRFANGAQGRLLYWSPDPKGNVPVPAYHNDLVLRFVKESSLQKREMIADVDHIDVEAREETLVGIRGNYALYQLPVVPAYALTIHKTQALSIKHDVLGCLEGVFALGQTYVLVSRVTDPQHLKFVGLPPRDLLDDVAASVAAAGLDVNKFFEEACAVTGEFQYAAAAKDRWTENVAERLRPRLEGERTIPTILRTLEEILNPQKCAMKVICRVLDWMDRVDEAASQGLPKPPLEGRDGQPLFPQDDDPWWLTDVQKRQATEGEKPEINLQDILEDGPLMEDNAPDKMADLLNRAKDAEDWTEDSDATSSGPDDADAPVVSLETAMRQRDILGTTPRVASNIRRPQHERGYCAWTLSE